MTNRERMVLRDRYYVAMIVTLTQSKRSALWLS